MDNEEYPRIRGLTAHLTEEDYRLVKSHVAAQGAKMKDWLREAAFEKMAKESRGK